MVISLFFISLFQPSPQPVLALYALFYRLSITSAFTFVLDATRFEDRLCLSLSIQTIGIDWTIVDLNIFVKSSPSPVFDIAEAIDCCKMKAIIEHDNVLSRTSSLYRYRSRNLFYNLLFLKFANLQ